MALVLLGINHNTANVSIREQVAFPPEKMADAMRRVTALEHVKEAVIVSTCNRTELYIDVDVVMPTSCLIRSGLSRNSRSY